jgi:hypothetical protein
MREELPDRVPLADVEAALGRYLADALHELLLGYGVALADTVALAPRSDERPTRAASIAFSARAAQGTVTLTLGEELLYHSLRALVADDVRRVVLTDWAGELANQLLGRLKAKLVGHQVVLQISTPQASASPLPSLPLTLADTTGDVVFVAYDRPQVSATMTVCLAQDFAWVATEGPDPEAPGEGELTFF